MENILDIVYEYSKNRKILDFDALNSIYNQIIKLYKVVDAGILREEFSIPLGHYTQSFVNPFTRNITMYPNAIKRDFIKKSEYNIKETEFTKFLNRNLYILFLLMHEMEHINQLNHRFDSELERRLCVAELDAKKDIRESSIFAGLKNYKKYDYYSSILERLANIKSREFIEKLINRLDLDDVKELQKLLALDEMMKPYKDENDAPTIRKLKNLGYDMVVEDKLSYETRFRYGFKLTYEEYRKNNELLMSKRR